MAVVKLVPSQMGPVSDYSTRAARDGPLWLLIKDIGVLATALPYLPLVFFPIRKQSANQDGRSRFAALRDNAIQALLLLVELVLLILLVPALVILPGLLFIVVFGACVLVIQLIAWPSQGPRIVESTVSQDDGLQPQRYQGERWVFINGICTGRSGLQENVNRISLLFRRKVQGIHNQSYGMIGDFVECLLQRCLSYSTMDVRVAVEVVKGHLLDREVKKVVLLAHSQGGIIASMVVDRVLMELSAEGVGKLEIYTFGSAASHFHAPPINTTGLPYADTDPAPVIRHIEHYANEYDMVPRWGVLYAIKNLLDNRYAGNVYVRVGATGHMFVDHYLDPIFFSLPGKTVGVGHLGALQNGTGGKKNAQANGQDVEEGDVEEADCFLNTLVDVEEGVEESRASRVKGKSLVKAKNMGQVRAVPVPVINGINGHAGNGTVNGVLEEPDSELAAILGDNRGKTVKDLSRLWKYLGGGEPED